MFGRLRSELVVGCHRNSSRLLKEQVLVVPKDFDIIELRFDERGGPRLLKGGALQRESTAADSPTEPIVVTGEGAP